MGSGSNAAVIVPLYIYPLDEGTWQPLYSAITKHPDLNFVVIVNPNSGPGCDPDPGQDYLREVPKLNAFPNVTTVGYLSIDWCRRPLSQSCRDIDRYAGWGRNMGGEGLYVEGIFVDESPNHVSDTAGDYLEVLRLFAKGLDGLRGDRLVIHNPGTPPEGDLSLFGSPDLVCVCEEPHSRYCSPELQRHLGRYPLSRDQSIFSISSIPFASTLAANATDGGGAGADSKDAMAGAMSKTIAELCSRGRYIFATSLAANFYESFGPCWADFVEAVEKIGGK